MSTTDRNDLYTRITAKIIEQLEQGVRPWFKPWSSKHEAGSITRPLRHNGKPYSGINVVCLWLEAEAKGFISPYWLTFRQVSKLCGQVKKGEHGSPVVYADTFKKVECNDKGEEEEREIRYLKEYTVFCADQCNGLPEHFNRLADAPKEKPERIEHAERFFSNTKANVRYEGNRACYIFDNDVILMPPFEMFRDAEGHAETLAHELIHWTRHPSRLDRELGRQRWGDEGYAREELIAEIGSAYLCADLRITPDLRDNHASYIASWLKILKDDKRAIVSAASHASRATDFLHRLQPDAKF